MWIKDLMQNGYTILDIKKMQLSDIELMVEALEKDKKAEKEEVEAVCINNGLTNKELIKSMHRIGSFRLIKNVINNHLNTI